MYIIHQMSIDRCFKPDLKRFIANYPTHNCKKILRERGFVVDKSIIAMPTRTPGEDSRGAIWTATHDQTITALGLYVPKQADIKEVINKGAGEWFVGTVPVHPEYEEVMGAGIDEKGIFADVLEFMAPTFEQALELMKGW